MNILSCPPLFIYQQPPMQLVFWNKNNFDENISSALENVLQTASEAHPIFSILSSNCIKPEIWKLNLVKYLALFQHYSKVNLKNHPMANEICAGVFLCFLGLSKVVGLKIYICTFSDCSQLLCTLNTLFSPVLSAIISLALLSVI